MEEYTHEDRCKTYMNAFVRYGMNKQLVVAVEELSECQKEICKIIRGGDDYDHLAEEVADATIVLEQVKLMYGLDEAVSEYIDKKIKRLDDRMKGLCDGTNSD